MEHVLSANKFTLEFLSFNKKTVSVAERMLFTERLAMLVETGNPLHTSLEILQPQIDNKYLKEIIEQVSEDINAGRSFARALSVHDQVFDKTYVNLTSVDLQFDSRSVDEISDVMREIPEGTNAILIADTWEKKMLPHLANTTLMKDKEYRSLAESVVLWRANVLAIDDRDRPSCTPVRRRNHGGFGGIDRWSRRRFGPSIPGSMQFSKGWPKMPPKELTCRIRGAR